MRAIDRLSDRRVRTAAKPGRLHDGGGLYLQITPRVGAGFAKSWELRYEALPRPDGKRRWRYMGLGPFPDVSLARAREKAREAREQRRNGVDPIEVRDREKAERIATAQQARTMDDVFAAYLASRERTWKGGSSKGSSSKEQWKGEWDRYVSPKIGSMLVSDVAVDDVLSIVEPIWTAIPVLADRVLSRIKTVIDYAIVRKWRQAKDNPAEEARRALPKHSQVHSVEHYAAMPESELPAFMLRLGAVKTPAAQALKFAILTATRSNETLGATWEEIDLANTTTWTIAAERMKGRKGKTKAYVVPLTSGAVALLKARKGEDATGLVFARKGRRLSRNAFCNLLRTMKVEDATPHGFRACFSSWTQDYDVAAAEVREACLAHTSPAVEAAYARGGMMQRRRDLLEKWCGFLETGELPGKVLELKRA